MMVRERAFTFISLFSPFRNVPSLSSFLARARIFSIYRRCCYRRLALLMRDLHQVIATTVFRHVQPFRPVVAIDQTVGVRRELRVVLSFALVASVALARARRMSVKSGETVAANSHGIVQLFAGQRCRVFGTVGAKDFTAAPAMVFTSAQPELGTASHTPIHRVIGYPERGGRAQLLDRLPRHVRR